MWPRDWGIRGRAPGGRLGAAGGHVVVFFIRGQESCSFLFPVLGSLGASLLARGANRQHWFMWLGEITCQLRDAQKPAREAGRPGAHTEVSGSAAETVPTPSATHPPSWQVVGCYRGGKQPGFLSVWLQKPGIRFQGRLVGCEIEMGISPPVL